MDDILTAARRSLERRRARADVGNGPRRGGDRRPMRPEPVPRYNELMKIALAALLIAAALPAAAQDRAAEIDFGNARAAIAAAARVRARETALTAMRDGVQAGGTVTRLLDEKRIEVGFSAQAEPVKTVVSAGTVKILLSDSLPAHPRVYAALIAAEAAKQLYSEMPACAERSYMRAATAARAFAELGGDFKSLPVVDGDRVDAVKAAVAAWTTDAQTALHEAGRADGVALLADLPRPSGSKAADFEAADRKFIDFLIDERDARRDAAVR